MNFRKIFLLLSLCVFCWCTSVQGQTQKKLTNVVSLGDYYKKYYVFFDRYLHPYDFVKGNLSSSPSSLYPFAPANGKLSYVQFNGNKNRHRWIFMPTYPGSNNYLIANKDTGDFIEVKGTSERIETSNTFNGDKSQVFKLFNLPNDSRFLYIFSAKNPELAITRTADDSYLYLKSIRDDRQVMHLHPNTNISNSFTAYQAPTNVAIQQPPAPTDLHGTGLVRATTPQVVGETIIPYLMVKNDLPRSLQVKFTPYYKVVRKQYWKQLGSQVKVPGIAETTTFSQTNGMTQFAQSEVTSTLDMTFTASASIGFSGLFASGSASASFSSGFGLSTTQLNSLETYQQTELTHEVSVDVQVNTLISDYQLVDRYELYRMDGTLVQDWEVAYPKERNTLVSFPVISPFPFPVGRTKVTNKAKVARLLNHSTTTNLAKLGYAAKVASANPFQQELKVEVKHTSSCQIKAVLYNKHGKAVKTIEQQLPKGGSHFLVIEGGGLAKGIYLLKVHAQGGSAKGQILSQRVVKD